MPAACFATHTTENQLRLRGGGGLALGPTVFFSLHSTHPDDVVGMFQFAVGGRSRAGAGGIVGEGSVPLPMYGRQQMLRLMIERIVFKGSLPHPW